MRVGGVLWGGGPMLRRRPARRAGRRPKHLSPFRRFLIANGIKRKSVPENGLGGKGYSGLEGMSGCKDDLPPFSAVGGIRA